MDSGPPPTHVMVSGLNNICGDGGPRKPTESDGSLGCAKHLWGLKFELKLAHGHLPHGALAHVFLSGLNNICGDGIPRNLKEDEAI